MNLNLFVLLKLDDIFLLSECNSIFIGLLGYFEFGVLVVLRVFLPSD